MLFCAFPSAVSKIPCSRAEASIFSTARRRTFSARSSSGWKFRGLRVAVVDARRLFVEAGGEDLCFGQIDGDGITVDAHVVFVDIAQIDPRLDVPGGYQEHPLPAEHAVPDVAPGLLRDRQGLGPAHRCERVELLYSFHDNWPRGSARRLLPKELSDQGQRLTVAREPDA